MCLARRLGVLLLLVPLTLATPVVADDSDDALERTLSPYFFVEGGDPSVDRLPLLGTTVTANVAGVIADVTVRQTYKNDGQRPIHARYVFPASTRAAVHGLSMTIGDEIVYAKIREREQAKQEFAAAKKAGNNAALLEQQRPNVFTMDVANIVPGQTIEVTLRYTELLVPTAGVYEFVYPTVVGPRYSTIPESGGTSHDQWLSHPYTHQDEPPRYTLGINCSIDAGVAVRDVESPSHEIQMTRAGSRVELALDSQHDRDFVLRYRLDGDGLQSGLMLYRGEHENFFLTMIQPPRRVALEEIPPREYVFVVDVSGSMNGFPLDVSKALLRDLIGHLRPTDTFNVLLFAGGSELWSPRSRPATPANVRAAIAMMEEQRGGGGTELLAAVRRAMALPRGERVSRSLVIVTDGYIAAEKEVFSHIRDHLDQANVFAFGIGSGVNRHLIEGIARAGQGEPFVVLNEAEAPATARHFREYVQTPLLTDVQVAFDGLEAYDVGPATIPDVMAERPIVVYGKWRGEARGRVHVTGVTGTGPFAQSLDVSAARPSESNRALRHLWARARIAELSDFGGGWQETDEERRQIVELGIAYSLLTRYTSFIAVREVVVNASGEGEDVKQPLPLPAGVTDLALGSGPEPGLAWLMALMLIAAAVVAWRRRATVAR